jgi:wobble nucleotide-excising tRNase
VPSLALKPLHGKKHEAAQCVSKCEEDAPMFHMFQQQNNSANGFGGLENQAKIAFTTWFDMQRPMIEAMTEMNGRLIEQVSRANEEWIGFVGRRLDEDLATSRRLMECRTTQDVMAAYAEYFQRAQKQYQSEIQHFTRLNQSMANETARAVRTSIEHASQANGMHH